MLYTITNSELEIDFAPSTEALEILQNCRMIISTIKNSVPLFRQFGLDAENLDKPISLAQATITAEIARQIATYEPRANLKKCTVTGNLDGQLLITCTVEI